MESNELVERYVEEVLKNWGFKDGKPVSLDYQYTKEEKENGEHKA